MAVTDLAGEEGLVLWNLETAVYKEGNQPLSRLDLAQVVPPGIMSLLLSRFASFVQMQVSTTHICPNFVRYH